MTDDRGDYVIPPLVVGRYQIRVEKDGFSPFLQPSVVLQANTQVQVDAILQVRALVVAYIKAEDQSPLRRELQVDATGR